MISIVFESPHRVACCGANIEVFKELWGAPILASYLLPDLCCHSPADREETGGGRMRMSEYNQVCVMIHKLDTLDHMENNTRLKQHFCP